jgi:hypothetical protein
MHLKTAIIGILGRRSTLDLGVLVLICIAAGWGVRTFWGHNSFQSSRWLAGSVRERGEIVRDLHSSGILIGHTRQEVLSLLGPPDGGSAEESGAYDYTVDVGIRFASSPWNYTFVVVFDPASDRVSSTDLRD